MLKKWISFIAVLMCIMMMVLIFASCGNDRQGEAVAANDYFTASDLDTGYDEATRPRSY
jgi:hypothetical protein